MHRPDNRDIGHGIRVLSASDPHPPQPVGQPVIPAGQSGRVSVHVLSDLSPLPGHSVIDTAYVPQVLLRALFGQPNAAGARVRTYAILDGAKLMGLEERLAASGLEHVCLYSAAEGEALSEVAPWLVALEQDNALTAELFTRSDAPWHLWEKAVGIFLRTTGTTDQVRAHLRKFIQVEVDQGRRVFFRFWEPRVLAHYALAHHAQADGHIAAFLGEAGLIAVDPFNDRAVLVRGQVAARPAGAWPMLHEDLAAAQLAVFCEDWSTRILKPVPPLQTFDKAERVSLVTRLVHQARQIGFRENKSVERYSIAAILHGAPPETDPRLVPILQSGQHELDRSRKLLEAVRALKGHG